MHVLIFRFSAMGDVALTVPVIRGALLNNPDLEITIVTKKFYSPFFDGIDRLHIVKADFKSRHKGLPGIIKLFLELKKQADYTLIIDLHSVLRTRFLSILFKFTGKKVFTFNKERRIKQSYLKRKEEPQLPHTIERYQAIFLKAGIHLSPMKPPVFEPGNKNIQSINELLERDLLKNKIRIGIAPFAKHSLKKWPIAKISKLIEILLKKEGVHIFLFGGGKEEIGELDKISSRFRACQVVNFTLDKELSLIGRLHVMISMDTGNMHLASLMGVPVISVWGATHPGIGFGPWNQPVENIVQIPKNELDCRPCTIYGKGICRRGDFACMEWILPEIVVGKVMKIIDNPKS